MNQDQISEAQLKQTATAGEQKATKALSVLAKREVNVKTTQVTSVDAGQAKASLDKVTDQAVIAFTKAVTGVSGACLLSLERKDALNMVDLFNNRPTGTTVVMQEIDRSTIRETLNILANAYITELANSMQRSVMLSVPQMITRDKLNSVSESVGIRAGQTAVLFQTELSVAGVDFQIELFFFFIAGGEPTIGSGSTTAAAPIAPPSPGVATGQPTTGPTN